MSVLEKKLPESEYQNFCNEAEENFRKKRYLQAMRIYEKLEETKHGHEIRFCKQICRILIGDFRPIKDLSDDLYVNHECQIKVPSHFYQKMIDFVQKNSNCQNYCYYFLLCFHK